jgi:hypothetical protein
VIVEKDISIASVSWIDRQGIPNLSAWDAVTGDWVAKVVYGLRCTANDPPPLRIPHLDSFLRSKEYRSAMFCRIRLHVDSATSRVKEVKILGAHYDPGWTPPTKCLVGPSEHFQGEASPLSIIYGERRHQNTSLPSYEGTVLANGVIKFRAGASTDQLGIKKAGSPYHVPWVWCEMLLLYSLGSVRLVGRGAEFPSHAWYFNEKQVGTIMQVSDAVLPVGRAGSTQIDAMNLKRALTTGRENGSRAQLPRDADSEMKSGGVSVERHPYTLKGGKIVSAEFRL